MNIEIARSYSEKVNLGNYQVSDYFCSAKCEVDEKEVDKKSKELFEWCKSQVKKEIEKFKNEQEKKNDVEFSNAPDKILNFKDIKINGD